ncbi:MAG: nucleotidyltransferase domain-containing protein [Candidatus Omnitrophica bacterium]|nr:nucleotidyltransferase domain-containing protein [Candidatus Omnitrophota bacterium]
MRFGHPLDGILGSKSKVRILRFLCRKGGEWSGRRVAAELAMTPVTAHKSLRALREATVLDLRKVGSHFFYSLRDRHYLIREVLRPLFERELNARARLVDVLTRGLSAKLRSRIVTAALYGSLARGEERSSSDMDLLLLVDSAEAEAGIRSELDRLSDVVMSTFGNPLAVYVKTVREAQRKARRGLPLFANILSDHQLLWGRPLKELLRGR